MWWHLIKSIRLAKILLIMHVNKSAKKKNLLLEFMCFRDLFTNNTIRTRRGNPFIKRKKKWRTWTKLRRTYICDLGRRKKFPKTCLSKCPESCHVPGVTFGNYATKFLMSKISHEIPNLQFFRRKRTRFFPPLTLPWNYDETIEFNFVIIYIKFCTWFNFNFAWCNCLFFLLVVMN